MATVASDQTIKCAAASWRENGYQGASAVTRRLLEFWFKEDHSLKDRSEFRFWRAQQEAIEATGRSLCLRPDDTFHNGYQSFRTRKNPKLETKAVHEYDKKGEYKILVKVVDIFGNDTTKMLEVKI